MAISHLIGVTADLVWSLVPLRHIKTKYFFYFLIYAIAAIFSLIDWFILLHPAYFYLGVGFFLIISLFNVKKIPNHIFFLAGVLIVSIILPFLLSIKTITYLLIIQHVTIFVIILKRSMLFISKNQKINLFHFVLLLYEITLVSRFIVVLQDVRTSVIFFYISTAFGIFIGIYFLFYNEKNSYKFPLKY